MTGRRVYPWELLESPGCSFIWPNRRDEASLRSQASKLGKRRSIEISVALIDGGILVTYVRGLI